MSIFQTEDYFENLLGHFLEEAMLFLLDAKSKTRCFPVLKQKTTQILL